MWQGVVLIGGVTRAVDFNMVPETISKKLEPMQQIAEGELMNAEKIIPVDLKMLIMKFVGAGWLFGLFN